MAHPATPTDMIKSFVPGPNPDTAGSPDVFEPPRLESSVLGVPSPIRTVESPLMVPDQGTLPPIRKFDTGATRDQDTTKFDYEGFLSPLALTRFAAYMHKNRIQADGTTRDSDNWQKGIPLESYMKSVWRHLMTVWRHHREVPGADREDLEDALCGVIFNAQGYLHEIMKGKR